MSEDFNTSAGDAGSSRPSIRESVGNAINQVGEIERELESIQTPNPVSTEGEPEQKKPDRKLNRAEQKNKDRRDAVEKAFAKGRELDDQRKASAAKREKADGEKSWSLDGDEDRKLRRDVLERAAKQFGGEVSSKDFRTPEFKETRERLRQAFPGGSLKEITSIFEKWSEALKVDPTKAGEDLQKWYLSTLPSVFKNYKAPVYAEGIGGSIQRAQDEQRDWEELSEFVGKHGNNAADYLRQLVEIHNSMVSDPVGTVARLVAANGGLNVPAQQQQQAVQPQHLTPEQTRMHEAVGSDIDRAISSGEFPGLEQEWMMEAVGEVLLQAARDGMRSNDMEADFRRAYQTVKEAVEANQSKRQALADELMKEQGRKERGSRSIAGSPSPPMPPRAKGAPGSTRAALERAFGRS